MPTIYGVPQAGLANRLIALCSMMRLADRLGAELKVCWTADHECMAAFGDLFQDVELEASEAETASAPVVERVAKVNNGKFYDSPGIPPEDLLPGPLRVVAQTMVYVRGEHPVDDFLPLNPLFLDVMDQFRRLRLADTVQRHLDSMEAAMAGVGTGLHVRRAFTKDSPYYEFERERFSKPDDAYFEDAAEQLLSRSEGGRLLLSTNDPDLEFRLRSRFGNRMVVFEKTTVNNSVDPAAIQQALVDLLLLSRCKVIMSNWGSTFGLFSAALTRRDLVHYKIDEACMVMRFRPEDVEVQQWWRPLGEALDAVV